ncbi:MAG: HAMP domain-containing histidine kinase [Hyphomonadaceae bacterium]|nr:MAG: sensor histidine kinase [Caulobacteraceae bacterium]MBT9445338.1 HAMP domain-containing histidine kinase [Hyphomonadaceae bacterium]TPW05922.1 MAG: sensor histidine kinase [Alphaproteobacteria bacterium]
MERGSASTDTGARRYMGGLARQLLALTIAFVVVADVVLIGPALGAFHDEWLRSRIDAAQVAALAREAAPTGALTEQLEQELLLNAGVRVVALQRDEERVLTLQSQIPADVAMRTVDLRTDRNGAAMFDALSSLMAPEGRLVRVLAAPRYESGRFIEVVIGEQQLKRDLAAEARQLFVNTLLVSLIVGGLLYAALLAIVVRRIVRLSGAIEAFGKRPNDPGVHFNPSGGDDEIARAEIALAGMEQDVRAALREKDRLAALGSAVAKLAHDLRNSLATAQLVTERLAGSDDPQVRQSAPRLERAIARAAALAEATLRYGKADELPAQRRAVSVRVVVEEAADDVRAQFGGVAWRNEVGEHLLAMADPEQLHRIFANLIRNAAQALKGQADGEIVATARLVDRQIEIDITDSGPGIPQDLRPRLFEPFASARRDGGVGLGLAIARELAHGMGGDVTLCAEGAGACFRVTLPAA